MKFLFVMSGFVDKLKYITCETNNIIIYVRNILYVNYHFNICKCLRDYHYGDSKGYEAYASDYSRYSM